MAQRKLHPRLVTIFLIQGLVAALLLGLWATAPTAKMSFEMMRGAAAAIVVVGPLMALSVQYDVGYRISWDDDAVYMRPPGFAWWLKRRTESAMRFEDIRTFNAEQDNRFGGTGRYSPAACIVIEGTTTPPGVHNNLILIEFDYFKREAILDFVKTLNRKRPDLVSTGWVRQIAANSN